ncbi:hypothetical protein GYMLUDRAFT_582984 [Collybiopsis luxurians FD-317 M1]|uniref:G-protein coupled receptors family 1 profile domain-containing protein n=1 Tax=Collybiopsis luxurians FD-317 M1 TaxID=944289 RepID=A0A0D0CYI9_9AGAR|nr:hypothetical protein GYMLUDRAFT_582984 [Collybiopsis luxurians FD-317 M1]
MTEAGSTAASAESSREQALYILFTVFQLAGLGGLIIIFITAWATSVVQKRHLCWSSFILSWIISSLSYSLLAGTSLDWQPGYSLCLAQAVLIYTVPTLTACTSLALVIQVLLTVRSFTTPPMSPLSARPSSDRLWTFMLLFVPYLLGAAMFTLSLVIGLKDHDTVTRPPGGFYCNMKDTLPGKISAIVVAAIMIICVFLGGTISIILRRHWRVFTNQSRTPLATAMRVLCFSAFSVVAIVLGIIFFFTPRSSHGPGLEIVLSLMPVAAVLVFGTQKDLIEPWKSGFQKCLRCLASCFRRKRDPHTQSTSTRHASSSRLCGSESQSSPDGSILSFNEYVAGVRMEAGQNIWRGSESS